MKQTAPARFQRKPEVVVAQQWYPGVTIPGVFADPLALVGQPWAHVGHQRELDGNRALVLVGDEPCFVHAGDWIVWRGKKCLSVLGSAEFKRQFGALTMKLKQSESAVRGGSLVPRRELAAFLRREAKQKRADARAQKTPCSFREELRAVACGLDHAVWCVENFSWLRTPRSKLKRRP